MNSNIILRELKISDFDIFFDQQLDEESNFMAAFTRKDPQNRLQFDLHWEKIVNDNSIFIRTIVWEDKVVGHILSFILEGEREVSYWIGKEYWGKGIATKSLKLFLEIEKRRPIYARVAFDNLGSQKVLERCGYMKIGDNRFFANARNEQITEFIYKLES